MTEQERIELNAIYLAVVNSIRRDFPNSSMSRITDEQALATAESWAEHLKHVPAPRVMGIYKSLAMGAKNPPVVADFANVWAEMYEREWRQRQDLKREQEDAELKRQHQEGVGRIGAKVSRMARERWAAGLDAVCCDCTNEHGQGIIAGLTADEEYFCCQERQCDFRKPVSKLMEIRVHPTFKPTGNLMPAAKPKQTEAPAPSQKELLSDDEIIQHLEERCGMNCDKVGTENAISFGRYFLEVKPVLTAWNRESAQDAWQEFKGELKHANAA